MLVLVIILFMGTPQVETTRLPDFMRFDRIQQDKVMYESVILRCTQIPLVSMEQRLEHLLCIQIRAVSTTRLLDDWLYITTMVEVIILLSERKPCTAM